MLTLYFLNFTDEPDRFLHNGFFSRLKDNLEYGDGTLAYYDNCCTDTFSLLWIEDFVTQGGNEVTKRTCIHWSPPGTDMRDGLCCIENDSHILAISEAM
jgi:hypothetical protein